MTEKPAFCPPGDHLHPTDLQKPMSHGPIALPTDSRGSARWWRPNNRSLGITALAVLSILLAILTIHQNHSHTQSLLHHCLPSQDGDTDPISPQVDYNLRVWAAPAANCNAAPTRTLAGQDYELFCESLTVDDTPVSVVNWFDLEGRGATLCLYESATCKRANVDFTGDTNCKVLTVPARAYTIVPLNKACPTWN